MKLFKQIRELVRQKKYHYSIDLVNTRETSTSENYSLCIRDFYSLELVAVYKLDYDLKKCTCSLAADIDDDYSDFEDDDIKELIFKFLLEVNEVNQ